MTTFQRARNDEQRAIRRQLILDTAAAMLREMPVASVSLNELSRRVGLAKSNVLRYFDSREAVLLELLTDAWETWLAGLPAQLDSGIGVGSSSAERAEQLANVLSESLAARPVLCDLLSAQAGVLEQNVNAEVAARYKRQTLAHVQTLSDLVGRHLPELGDRTTTVCAQAVMAVGVVWTHARPSASMLEAYAADPSLAALRMEFTPALSDMLATLIAGTLARPAR